MRRKWKSRIPILKDYTSTTNFIEAKLVPSKTNPHKFERIEYYIYPEGICREDGYVKHLNLPNKRTWEDILGEMIENNNW